MSALITQNIPFIAGDTTWENWNGNMLHYFGQEPLPYLPEDNWKDFARSMSSLSTFSVYNIPDPEAFENWQDWVQVTVGLVNGPTE